MTDEAKYAHIMDKPTEYHINQNKQQNELAGVELAVNPHPNTPLQPITKEEKNNDQNDEDNQDTKQQSAEDTIVAKFNEDIWALGYVIAKTEKGLPCLYVYLLVFIYFIQLGTLIAMIYSFYCTVAYDVIDKSAYFSSGKCINIGMGKASTELMPNPSMETLRSIGNYTISSMTCYDARLIKADDKNQYYDGAGSIMRWTAATSDVMWVFVFCQGFSFCVLGIYVISSLMNPLVMFTISYNRVKRISVFLYLCTNYKSFMITLHCHRKKHHGGRN